MTKTKCIGIIAEDNSDFESVKVLINRISSKRLSYKKAIGNGCGRLKRKAIDYSIDLEKRGCDTLILFHDLDRNSYTKLKDELEIKLKDSPIDKKLICIPIEELEAWFLSDPEAIKSVFNLRKTPKTIGTPETINSPKEFLAEQVEKLSDKERVYINTKHNEKLANKLSIDLAKKRCSSFKHLHDFVKQLKF